MLLGSFIFPCHGFIHGIGRDLAVCLGFGLLLYLARVPWEGYILYNVCSSTCTTYTEVGVEYMYIFIFMLYLPSRSFSWPPCRYNHMSMRVPKRIGSFILQMRSWITWSRARGYIDDLISRLLHGKLTSDDLHSRSSSAEKQPITRVKRQSDWDMI